MSENDTKFAAGIPDFYESHMVPMVFAPWAGAIAERLARYGPGQLLEVAAGTGALTRVLTDALPDTEITATDLNQAMIDVASKRGTSRPVTWKQADAQALPFADGSFDVVVCNFGVMFLPDRVKAFREVGRVLRGGGYYVFTVWDRVETFPIEEEVDKVLVKLMGKPESFLRRVPHGSHDPEPLKKDLKAAGFYSVKVEPGTMTMRAASAKDAATAYCLGTPLRNELNTLGPGTAEKTVATVQEAIEKRFGTGPIEAPMGALTFTVGPV
ncbi:MAG: class I SAM-dependent methyltransferase [Myxococcaceae bacterium]